MNPALLAHVAGGGVALAAGAVALCAPKGGPLHRTSGGVFTAAMLVMAAAATTLALTLPDRGNLPGGVFSVYLVITAWGAGRAAQPGGRSLSIATSVLGLVAAAIAWEVAQEAYRSPSGEIAGKPLANFVACAALATFAVALDVRVLLARALDHRQRIARHVWRMCAALFFATGSFFLGQQKVMPHALQGSPALMAPALAPLVVMVFWLARLRRRARTPLAARSPA